MKVLIAMICTHCNHTVLEHEDIREALFTYGISLKPISNTLVDDANILFMVKLELNCILIYGDVLLSIQTPLEVVAEMIKNCETSKRVIYTMVMEV